MPAPKTKPPVRSLPPKRRMLPKPSPRPDHNIRLGWAKDLMSISDDFFDDDLKRGDTPKRGK